MITGRACSRSIQSEDSGRHEKVTLGMRNEPTIADVLAELKSQKEDIKKYVNCKISTLRQEIQGVNISVSSELKKIEDESEISWKTKGNKSSTVSTQRFRRR